MKKILLSVFTLISITAFSQDSVYEITNQLGTIVIKTGTTAQSAPTYLGSQNIDELSSQISGSVIIKRNGVSYYVSNSSYISPVLNNSVFLGSTVFTELSTNFSVHTTATLFDTVGGNAGTQLLGGSLPYQTKSWSGEEPGGLTNDNKTKTIWYDVYLSPTFFDNLIENDEVWIRNRSATLAVTGGFANGNDVLVLKKVGNQLIVTSSIGYNQVTLSTNEILNSKSKIFIYPNPTNNFITIQNEENTTENFEYKIVDLIGRIVKNGNSKFNEQINIESLESGNYIIQIETENGEKLTKKLLKN